MRSSSRLAASALLVVAIAAAGPLPPVAGRWLTESGGGVIEIGPCAAAGADPGGAEAVCGRIVGLKEFEADGSAPRDWRGGTQCGLRIIDNARLNDDGVWEGRITDPRDGRVYGADLRVDDRGRLRLRGFLGLPLLGSTQTWTRYAGRVAADCRMVP